MTKAVGGFVRAWLDSDDELTFVGLRPQCWQLACAKVSEVLPRSAGQVVELDVFNDSDDSDVQDNKPTIASQPRCACGDCAAARVLMRVLAVAAATGML